MASLKKLFSTDLYPSKKEKLQTTKQEIEYCIWNKYKIVFLSIFLALAFLFISLPHSYKFTGNFLGVINSQEFMNEFPIKLSFLHSFVFFFISFALIYTVNYM